MPNKKTKIEIPQGKKKSGIFNLIFSEELKYFSKSIFIKKISTSKKFIEVSINQGVDFLLESIYINKLSNSYKKIRYYPNKYR